MTFVMGVSAHGSPGLSTVFQLLAAHWPNPQTVPVVVEADASGGVLAARYGLSLTPGMVTLSESLRKGEKPALLDHAQRLPSGVACVPISPSATASSAQLRSSVGFLGPYLGSVDHPVLLDAGTVLPDSRVMASAGSADLLLWFVRPNREELLVLRHRLIECSQPGATAIVLIGDSPYNAGQVEQALGVSVIGVLPIDDRGATAVNAGGDDRFLRRSPLSRACAKLAEQLQHHIWMQAVSSDKPAHDERGPEHTERDRAGENAENGDVQNDEHDENDDSESGVIDLSTLPPPPPPPSSPPSSASASSAPDSGPRPGRRSRLGAKSS